MLAVILTVVPFSAFLTVVAGNAAGHYELWRVWKELLLLLLAPFTIYMAWRTPALRQKLTEGWLFWAMNCYVLLHIGLGLIALHKGQVNGYALVYALVVNLRLLLVYLVAYVLAWHTPWLRERWRHWLLWPAVGVVAFGLLQLTVLPHDFLRHFGYGPATIAPFETVDNKPDYARLQSTLRGPNPLGAYLIIVAAGCLALLRRPWQRGNSRALLVLLAAVVVLVFTYSRSAYVGLAVAVLASAIMGVRHRQERRWLGYGLLGIALIFASLFFVFKDNSRLENTLYHTNEDSHSAVSSNEQRMSAIQSATRDVLTEPFGRGPGTAGPASVHNSRPGRIAEDYYLQIGQETGWLGLTIFIAIVVMVARRLWRLRQEPLARLLLVSLAGISFINLVQHAWTDDTLALVWWGMAGICLSTPSSPGILKHKRRSDEEIKQPIRPVKRHPKPATPAA
jgi:energy-coupling factor transporter transmembrane protein EcfT